MERPLMPTLFPRTGDQEHTEPERVDRTAPTGGILFADTALMVRWRSPGLRARVAGGTSVIDLIGPAEQPAVRRAADAVLGGGDPVRGLRIELRGLDGPAWGGELSIEAVDPSTAPGSLLFVIHPDVTEDPSRPEVSFRADHDQLTGLPNRWTLIERLEVLLDRGPTGVAAALLIDLDRLKVVNDSLGHGAGDRLLTEVALRLRHAVGDTGIVARIGGDEFVVLVDGLEAEYEATQVADRILAAMRPPVLISERQHVVTASVGIVFIEGATAPAEVLRDADTAMYEAKAQGRDQYVVFDELLRVRAVSRFDVEEDLRRALLAGEFRVHFQPQVSLETGRIVAGEALVRWDHPEHGLIFPGAFIGIAEETGLVKDIGELVLRETCEAAVRFQRKARNGVPIGVSVNVSPSQLDDLAFVTLVEQTLAANGLAASSLTLELTENALVVDDPSVVLSLGRLRDLGVRIAIDDFGTGYSSLSYLSRIPAQELKIDRAFILDMTTESGRSVVDGICRLARGVGLTVVAEGVETEEQAGWLSEFGCQTIQGFLVAKGLSRKEFVKAVSADRGRAFRSPAASALR